MNGKSAACDGRDTIDGSIFQHFFEEKSTEQQRLLGILLKTVRHFFGDFRRLFSNVTDPRNPRRIIYDTAALAVTGILMFCCVWSRAGKLDGLCGRRLPLKPFMLFSTCRLFLTATPSMPRSANPIPANFQRVVCDMDRRLIVSKRLDQYRLLDKHFAVAVDGTGILSFEKRHCRHCMTRTHNGKTTYYPYHRTTHQ